jgi:molecular chaperone GrpE
MENEVVKPRAGRAEEPVKTPETGEVELPADLPAAYRSMLAEKDDLYDRLLRKQAELENARKRLQREKEEFLQHAAADLIRALLPVLDGFERALKHRDAKVPADFYQGVELIQHHLLDVLGRAGLAPVETAGKTFDPHLHQAVESV